MVTKLVKREAARRILKTGVSYHKNDAGEIAILRTSRITQSNRNRFRIGLEIGPQIEEGFSEREKNPVADGINLKQRANDADRKSLGRVSETSRQRIR